MYQMANKITYEERKKCRKLGEFTKKETSSDEDNEKSVDNDIIEGEEE